MENKSENEVVSNSAVEKNGLTKLGLTAEEKPIHNSKKIFVYIVTLVALYFVTVNDTDWMVTASKGASLALMFLSYTICKSVTDVAFIMAHAESLLERDPNKSAKDSNFFPKNLVDGVTGTEPENGGKDVE